MLPLEIAGAALRGELPQVIEWLKQGGHVDALDKDVFGTVTLPPVENGSIQWRRLGGRHGPPARSV